MSGAPPSIDYIQKSIGGFGRYHYWLCFIVFLSKLPIAWHQLAIIFLAPKVSYTCNGNVNECPCSDPVYDTSIFSRTIVMEWNLICERKWLASLVQMLYMLGTLIGSIVFGIASDRYGRRSPFIVAIIIQTVAGILAAFAPTFWLFNFLRFLIGMSVGGTMVIGFVVCLEFCGTKYRPTVSALYQIPFNVGHLMLAGFGYLFRDYAHFQIAISIPTAILISYYCLLPETPRWLIAASKTEETIKLCERVAKINNLPTSDIRTNITTYQAEVQNHNLKKGNMTDLFRTPNLRRNILCMAYNWFTCSYCFYGVSQYISHLTGDIFINVAASAVVVLIGTFLSIPILQLMRRKPMLLIFQTVCAVCLYILAFIPESFASICFACIGNVAAFIVFILVYLYCSELFPTVVRNSAMGFSSMAARIGAMVAPFVIDLRAHSFWLPAVVFALVPTFAVLVTLLLPETKDCLLMTTIEEGEEFGRRKRNTPNA